MDDLAIYLGPYFSCNVKQVESPCEILCCTNSDCFNFHRHSHAPVNFCFNCGGKLSKVEITVFKDAVDQSDLKIDLEESLVDLQSLTNTKDNNGIHIWMSNSHMYDSRNFYINVAPQAFVHNNLILPFSKEAIDLEMKAFADFYQKEHKILKAKYGKNETKVEWGLLTYQTN